jgi:class 3 adenylate cyclase
MSIHASLHILVVDDEPDLAPLIRQRFRRQIRAGEFEFTIASDGYEALQKLEEVPEIDLVLTDINMPRMDGLTLLAKLPDAGGMRKAVVVTAYGDMENIRTAMNRGAFDFLTKPIDLDDLEVTIEKARGLVDRERKASLVREAFGRYVSEKIVSELVDRPDGIKLGGEERVVTIMMADLRGFSLVSERLAPEQVVEVLNVYLGRMADVINAFDGTIDEFIGDGILAVFGAPVQGEDDAQRAVACAIAMQMAMDDVNAELADRGFAPMELGIGINTGEVVVGNIGSHVRAKYGVVGSNVNLTGRIESFTVGGQILVSSRTIKEGRDGIQTDNRVEVRMKGFAKAVPLFEVSGVGQPYNLSLPKKELDLADLTRPIEIIYSALDGKHVADELCRGRFVAIADRGAIVDAPDGLDALANIWIRIDDDAMDAHRESDVYAKVVSDETQPGRYVIRFTGIPPDLAAALATFKDSA